MHKTISTLIVAALFTHSTGVLAQNTVQPTDLNTSATSSALQQFYRTLAHGFRPLDAPWDPRGGAQLFDQIPNWDNAAEKRCCSGLRREEFLKMACDTDQPRGGRTNRC